MENAPFPQIIIQVHPEETGQDPKEEISNRKDQGRNETSELPGSP